MGVNPLHDTVTTSFVSDVPGLTTPPRLTVPVAVASARTGGSAMTFWLPRPIPIMEIETTARTRAILWRIDIFKRTSNGLWRDTKDEETFINGDDRRRDAHHLYDFLSVGSEFTFCS